MNGKHVLIAVSGCGLVGAAIGVLNGLRDHVSTRHLSRGDLEILYDAHHEVTSRFLKRRFGDIIVSTRMGLTRRLFIGALEGFVSGACLPVSLVWTILYKI